MTDDGRRDESVAQSRRFAAAILAGFLCLGAAMSGLAGHGAMMLFGYSLHPLPRGSMHFELMPFFTFLYPGDTLEEQIYLSPLRYEVTFEDAVDANGESIPIKWYEKLEMDNSYEYIRNDEYIACDFISTDSGRKAGTGRCPDHWTPDGYRPAGVQ